MSRSEFNVREAAEGFRYQSGKTFTHSVGLSACFRQWRAESHCRLLHGYSLQVEFAFSTKELDIRNWAVDFGSLKSLKGWLEDTFDHKTLVAEDDPKISIYRELEIAGMVELRVVPSTGCEAFSRMIYEYAEQWLSDNGYDHVVLESVTVREHEANWASYGRDPR
jgi:6-pyruvoyltetrahydropterin/6-carboxytetrahydropterin synthase